MIKSLFIALISTCVFISNICYSFETKAEYAILVDALTQEVLFEKNADTAMAPSSMSKLMTIYMVFDALKKNILTLNDKFTVSENAWKKAGSKMFIHVNDQVSIQDLLRGIIIQSGNDACITIAEGMSGSEENFAHAMNEKAKEIGLKNSYFKNSTGWPEEHHLMSSRDLSILAYRLINDFPEYYNFFSEQSFTYNNIKQDNRNMLLSRNVGADGLKTGHTEIAGYGITASAKKDERRLILVVNGLGSTVERANEAEKLLQYGFLNFKNLDLFKAGEVVDNAKTWLGKEEIVPLATETDIIITVPKYSTKDIKVAMNYNMPIKAPIEKGQKLGELKIEISDNSQPIYYNLVATKSIEKISSINKFFKNILYLLFNKF
ncbi:MAG: D-alanyl-D-alanine carboxypeptidase family protein [Alphaproteobacteria bacterium]